ncbi:hypothetical protein HN777_04960 [Candidatus Woesearchaeota archaeon]|nr:hypothetical protein [Candidatus Woesearchaeota archaeon]
MKEKTIGYIRQFILFVISMFIAIGILALPVTQNIINAIASIQYFGIFISGVLFTYSTTTLPALAIFIRASNTLTPYLLIPIGAFGAMLGDIFIFKYVKKLTGKEIKLGTLWLKNKHWVKQFNTVVPIFSMIILASPLPDELAVGVFNISKYDLKKFALLAFVSKCFGIAFIFWTVNLI